MAALPLRRHLMEAAVATRIKFAQASTNAARLKLEPMSRSSFDSIVCAKSVGTVDGNFGVIQPNLTKKFQRGQGHST